MSDLLSDILIVIGVAILGVGLLIVVVNVFFASLFNHLDRFMRRWGGRFFHRNEGD